MRFLQLMVLPAAIWLFCAQANAAMVTRRDPVPANFFGWVIQRAHINTAWPDVPFGTWRLWDSYLKWSDVEPQEGVFKFDAFDRQVSLAEQHGKETIYTFGQTPRWASSTPDEKHAWGMGAGSPPVDIQLWKRYVEKVVSRYKGRILAYEVWNEPKYKDSSGKCAGAIFYCGSAAELVTLTAAAAEIVKLIDPGAILASPGFTDGLKGVDRLDEYLAAGGAKYVQAISFHFYALNPEEAFEMVRALRSVMKKHNLQDLPIWDTEHGYLIQNQDKKLDPAHSQGPFSRVFGPEQAADAMARAHFVEAAAGVDRLIWYSWDNIRTGVVGLVDGKPSAFAAGYRLMHDWLIGSKIQCADAAVGGYWRCNLQRNGRVAEVAWGAAPASAKRYVVPGTGKAWSGKLFGDGVLVQGGQALDLGDTLTIFSLDGRPW